MLFTKKENKIDPDRWGVLCTERTVIIVHHKLVRLLLIIMKSTTGLNHVIRNCMGSMPMWIIINAL